MATTMLKQFALIGFALAFLGGCASQQEKPADAPKEDASAARAAADKKAAEDAAAEKKASEDPAARAAADKKAADEAEAKRRSAAAAPPPPPKDVVLKSSGLFDFDKAVLRPDAKAALDKDLEAKLQAACDEWKPTFAV